MTYLLTTKKTKNWRVLMPDQTYSFKFVIHVFWIASISKLCVLFNNIFFKFFIHWPANNAILLLHSMMTKHTWKWHLYNLHITSWQICTKNYKSTPRYNKSTLPITISTLHKDILSTVHIDIISTLHNNKHNG